ncbi:MAG: argininosuccinate lyase [Desulfovibrionaceae bacterium]|nr:argininosuccinate lyase [Desulfovibrionaceae bacterium]MBF0513568.1 argininosuccinate lyase [Desulfovibrionaceae bacterium]
MSTKKMWGGRFAGVTSGIVERYTASVDFDWRLYAEDIRGSIAHARMLARQGVISAEEASAIAGGLEAIGREIEQGAFVWRPELEDVHMNIESRLSELIGEAGKKLHTGRSRNDQVALGFRLYVAGRLEGWRAGLKRLAAAFTARAGENAQALLPGYTHMQPAQPVSLAHHLLAYAWMFKRDFERIGDCLTRVKVSPLGAAALAGTTYPLDPASVAAEVGFPEIFKNSLDAVSDRDFVVEALSCGALVMAHLSRFCEEIALWANPNFGYLRLPDGFATGSSIMPQKKNPDVAELMRGKTGRVYGALTALLTTIKGLPLSYNRDLQEDKEPFMDAEAAVADSIEIMAAMVAALTFLPERMRQALRAGFLNATELADYLAAKGLPFREAHHAAGAAVALAESKGCGLEDLGIEELRALSPLIQDDVYAVLSYEACVARRTTPGGTSPESVMAQIAELQEWTGA